MSTNKVCTILFITLFITVITGCGGGVSTQATTASAIPQGTLQTVSLTPVNQSIAANTHQQYIATGTYINPNSTQDITGSVTWGSSNTNIATVSGGLAAALATAGTTTISASYAGKTGATRLMVTTATISTIVVTPTNPSIPDGLTQQFTATGHFNDGSTQDITVSATWSSGTQSIATISNTAGSKGLATAVAAGTSTISATYGGQTGSTTLTVTPATLQSIAITPANPSIANGSTQQFTATGTYSDGTTQNLTTTVTWSSSSTGVATISNSAGSKGLATAVGAGTTTITGTSGSVSNHTTLTVTGSSTVSMTWDAPTQFMDGSPLNPGTDLQSYKLYYGTVSQTYTQVITFSNPGTSTVTQSVTLPTGTYFFVVTSVALNGNESLYSNEVSKSF